MGNALSKESAEKELQRFYDYYEIDKESMNEDQKTVIEGIEIVMIKGIQSECIEFQDDDELGFCIVQKTKKGTVIKYREMNGEAKLAMSKQSESDSFAQSYALLGSLSGEGSAVIKKLRGPDLKRAEHIGTILLFC